VGSVVCVYVLVRGMGAPRSAKARVWTGVGSVSLVKRCPAKETVLRVTFQVRDQSLVVVGGGLRGFLEASVVFALGERCEGCNGIGAWGNVLVDECQQVRYAASMHKKTCALTPVG
jgi:hypothetical protein